MINEAIFKWLADNGFTHLDRFGAETYEFEKGPFTVWCEVGDVVAVHTSVGSTRYFEIGLIPFSDPDLFAKIEELTK